MFPRAAQLALTRNNNFIIKNIGTGPCLNLTFDFVPIDSNPDPKRNPNPYARRFPYVGPIDDFESPFSPATVAAGDYRFTARYESLSGKKYLTEMILHTRGGGTVLLREDWIFKTV